MNVTGSVDVTTMAVVGGGSVDGSGALAVTAGPAWTVPGLAAGLVSVSGPAAPVGSSDAQPASAAIPPVTAVRNRRRFIRVTSTSWFPFSGE